MRWGRGQTGGQRQARDASRAPTFVLARSPRTATRSCTSPGTSRSTPSWRGQVRAPGLGLGLGFRRGPSLRGFAQCAHTALSAAAMPAGSGARAPPCHRACVAEDLESAQHWRAESRRGCHGQSCRAAPAPPIRRVALPFHAGARHLVPFLHAGLLEEISSITHLTLEATGLFVHNPSTVQMAPGLQVRTSVRCTALYRFVPLSLPCVSPPRLPRVSCTAPCSAQRPG